MTNGFSKKWENLWAALCLHFAYYNFCRVHRSSRVAAAMEAGLTDPGWTIGDLLSQAIAQLWPLALLASYVPSCPPSVAGSVTMTPANDHEKEIAEKVNVKARATRDGAGS